MRRWFLFLGLAGLSSACSGDDGGNDGWTARIDTLANGALRVVNTPPAGGVRPTWVLAEEIRIGTVDEAGPASFGQIKGLAPLEDGRIAVLDAQAQEIRIFGPEGDHLATFGGKGSGPGELEGAFGLMRGPEGMLWVPDHRNARMSVYDPDGGFDRSYPFMILSRGFIWRGVMTPDGRVLKPSIILTDRSAVLRVFDREMNLIDSLPMPPRPEVDQDDPPGAFVFGSRQSGSWGYYGVPYFPQANRVLDPQGAIWTTSYGDPSYRIVRWDLAGDTTLVLETRRDPVPVTRPERDSVIKEVLEALRQQGVESLDWWKIPDVKPAVLGMFVAENGYLWVRAASPDRPTTYDVYERNGRYAGTAVSALHVYPYIAPTVRTDRFWAVVIGPLDVQYVVRARMRAVGEDAGVTATGMSVGRSLVLKG